MMEKSTLIGRLLYDSDSIHTDQLGVLQKQTKQEGVDIDLSLITDGLRAEREQGLPLMLRTNISLLLKENLSLQMRLVTNNIPEI